MSDDKIHTKDIFKKTDEVNISEMLNSSHHNFKQIYDNDVWTHGSGPGSLPKNTKKYRNVLTEIIKKYNIKSVLDYGCGDWQFSKLINYNDLVELYIGVDVVHSVIQNNLKYSNNKIFFQFIDDNWQFKKVDLIICKDVLQHLPNDYVTHLYSSMKKHCKYMLITNDIFGTSVATETKIGGYRPIDICNKFNIEPIFSTQYNVNVFIKKVDLIKGELL